MPLYDVFLVPCVTVKVPHITAETMADAVVQAEATAELHRLFDPLNHLLPPGVAWVEWSEECSHTLVDALPPQGEGEEPVASHFLNTAHIPVSYDHTTGCWLHLREEGQVVKSFGPFRHIEIEHGYLNCTPWQPSANSQAFLLIASGLVHHNRVYPCWSVESIEIPDHVGLPLTMLSDEPAKEEIP